MDQTTVKAVAGFIRLPIWGGSTVLVRAREVKTARLVPRHRPTNLSRDISIHLHGQSLEELDRNCREHCEIVMDDGKHYLTDANLEEIEIALTEALKEK